jgi:hypothetical protein
MLVILSYRHKNDYFYVDYLRRSTRKIGAYFLYQLELLTATIKKIYVLS